MVAPQPDSNPGPSAPLGPAPAPRAPRGLPPLSALPLAPAPPGSLCSGSVAGSGDVATQRGAAWIRVIRNLSRASLGPAARSVPSSPAGAAALPLRGGVLLPPCMRHRRSACATSRAGRQRLPAHRASRSASCRAACRPFGRASASTAANTGAEGALSPPHMLPRLGPLFALVRVGGRIKRPTGRGGMAVRPRTPRGTAMSLHPCLQCTVASARRERSSAIEKGLATCSV